MEFVEGTNLRQLIQRGDLKPEEVLAIIPQVCEALQYAHEQAVVHRDIKPENILIDNRGRVKIADFGLAKLLDHDAAEHALTATHQVMGTLRYMAPEQLEGSRDVDHRADIYSLGVIFYELLTRELPIGRFAPPSKKVAIDVRLDEVVLRALEKEPEQRYQQASDVKSEIETISRTSLPTNAAHPDSAKRVEPIHETSRFAMTPNWSYARRVGIPMAILFGLFSMATMTAHSVYGQKDNYQEQPLLRIIISGATLFWVGVIILHLVFFARRRASRESVVTPFVGTPLTQMRFAVPATTDIARQAIFHFSSLGYQLVEQEPDVCIFQRGGPWAGLWETDIRKIATRLTVRTVPAADEQAWVSCDWSVRTMGSWITRRDIRQLQSEGIGFQTLLGVIVPPEPAAVESTQWPRFSRFAIVGAVFFPLLIVFAGIAVPCALALRSMFSLELMAAAIPGGALAVVVCSAISLTLWRKIGPEPSATTAGSPEDVRSSLRLAGLGVLIAGIADAAAGCVWIGVNVSQLWNAWENSLPLSGLIIQTLLSLGSLALVYYVVGIGLWLMKLDEECDPSIPLLCAAIAPPGCVIGLPAAIFAFMQLTKPEARALVARPVERPESTAADHPHGSSTSGIE